jgi:hypothetical protein
MLKDGGRCIMYRHLCLKIVAFAILVGPMAGQVYEKRATVLGPVSGGHGKCTVEVVVDGTTDVEIRGDQAVLRNVNGQAPQWRRFDCTGPLPTNPVDFRFSGVDGRGSQQLIRDPRTDGVAVVRITDRQGGPEGYTFDITWSGGSVNSNERIYSGQNRNEPYYDRGGPGGPGRLISTDEAIRICEDAVRQEAAQRFRMRDIEFRREAAEDNRGPRDIVAGTFVSRIGQRGSHRFSCTMNLNTGRLQAVQIDDQQIGGLTTPLSGYAGATYATPNMRACERAVQGRVRRDGYQRAVIGRMDSDSPNRIVGTVTADRGNASDMFDFACFVNPNGTVRSVQVDRR